MSNKRNSNADTGSSLSKRSKAGAATYRSTFQKYWNKEWPFIKKGTTINHFWCTICRVERSCAHQGRRDVERHVDSEGHSKKTEELRMNQKVSNFFPPSSSLSTLESKVRHAEVKMTATLVKYNVPLAFADHLSPLLAEIFPDSDIAKA